VLNSGKYSPIFRHSFIKPRLDEGLLRLCFILWSCERVFLLGKELEPLRKNVAIWWVVICHTGTQNCGAVNVIS
jgi:hypothetical protein